MYTFHPSKCCAQDVWPFWGKMTEITLKHNIHYRRDNPLMLYSWMIFVNCNFVYGSSANSLCNSFRIENVCSILKCHYRFAAFEQHCEMLESDIVFGFICVIHWRQSGDFMSTGILRTEFLLHLKAQILRSKLRFWFGPNERFPNCCLFSACIWIPIWSAHYTDNFDMKTFSLNGPPSTNPNRIIMYQLNALV